MRMMFTLEDVRELVKEVGDKVDFYEELSESSQKSGNDKEFHQWKAAKAICIVCHLALLTKLSEMMCEMERPL